jgi:hypothetical protein
MQQVQEQGLWALGLAFTSRLMLGSTVVGVLSAWLIGGLYWSMLKRRQQQNTHS